MFRRVLAVMVACTGSAWAQDGGGPLEPPPSAEMIKQVMDYYENGKDRGPALVELLPCAKVDTTKGSATIYQCIEPVSGAVKKGTTVFAWMQWYCPKDGKYEDVQLQYLHEGQVRQTIDLSIAGMGRTRTYRGSTLNKVGKWTIKVTRGDKELGTATVDVSAQ